MPLEQTPQAPPRLDGLWATLRALWLQAVDIWLAGGWGMVAIAVIALLMFGLGIHMHRKLKQKGIDQVPERVWRQWIGQPVARSGHIGDLLDQVTGGTTLAETAMRFQGLRAAEVAPFDRDLRMMRICVGAAPLLGLFGTVTGMLATFGALATGSGGDKTMAAIARGISEALITTETGLVIALPGLFFSWQLSRKLERYRAFLAHLETVCTQFVYRQLRRESA